MFNRYPAPCRYCGGTIPPESGMVEKVGESWQAAHLACVEANRNEVAAFDCGGPVTAVKRHPAVARPAKPAVSGYK